MVVVKCDRCKAEIRGILNNTVHIVSRGIVEIEDEYDLCDKCWKDSRKWMNGEDSDGVD